MRDRAGGSLWDAVRELVTSKDSWTGTVLALKCTSPVQHVCPALQEMPGAAHTGLCKLAGLNLLLTVLSSRTGQPPTLNPTLSLSSPRPTSKAHYMQTP